MTHFYFHSWRDDQRFSDEQGLELPDQKQAQDLAARDLGEMARDYLRGSTRTISLGVDIADGEGVLLAKLRVNYTVDVDQ